jgi:uncharacterized protein (TIGR03083 family)
MLRELGVDQLRGPSDLAGWTRLTIVCHLRYGASALLRMTRDALAGRTTSYYSRGRAQQRPSTLEPRPTETAAHVVASLGELSAELNELWEQLSTKEWSLDVTEPDNNPDLGTVSLGRLAFSRLLEVDVHGTDLAIGFPDWSHTLVEVALPTRLGWLATRRTNHREFDPNLHGSWLVAADLGPRWLITVDGDRVQSRPATPADEPTASIRGTSRDLLALLLGRPPKQPLLIEGDTAFGHAFSKAFPGH